MGFNSFNIPCGCAAALGGLFIGQSFWVSVKRNQTQDGRKGDLPSLERAIRSHRNTSEYIGYLSAAFLYFHLHPLTTPRWVKYAIIVATVGRFLIAWGLYKPQDRLPWQRVAGAYGTYFGGAALTGFMLWSEFRKLLR